MAVVGDYDASTFVEGNYATYPQLPPGVTYYQPSMSWRVIGAGVVQGQPVVVGDMLFATQGTGRPFGAGLYGDQIYGGTSDADWTVSQVFFLAWDSTRPPPDLDPYPNAGCPFTKSTGPNGDWAPGWRIVIDAFYNDVRDSRTYGQLTYGDDVYGDAASSGGASWVDITQPAFSIVCGDGNREGEQRVVVAELVIELVDEEGMWVDFAEPYIWYQPQPGTPLRVGFIDPEFRYHPIIVGQLERVEDVHETPPRLVGLRGFGQLMDLVVDVAGYQRPSEMLSTRYRALADLAGWRWSDDPMVFPGDIQLHADLDTRDIVVRDEIDRTVQSAGWFLDSDRRGRMRVREWPHVPQQPVIDIVDCHPTAGEIVPGEPGYLTPLVGTATSPLGGVVPRHATWIFRVQMATTGPSNQTVAAQWEAGAVYILGRNLAPAGQTVPTWFDQAGGVMVFPAPFPSPVPTGDIDTYAVTLDQDDDATHYRFTSWQYDESAWTQYATSARTPKLPANTLNASVRIGAFWYPGTDTLWHGRIYSAELRTGLDPSPSAARYLNPPVGTVTTPDPGPPPNEAVYVFKIRGPNTTTTNQMVIVGQFPAAPQRSWLIRRHLLTATPGDLMWTPSVDGSSGAPSYIVDASPITGDDETLALAVTINDGTGNTRITAKRQTGAAWADIASATNPTIVPFDSTGVLRVGAHGTSTEPFFGRIYSVELRTGLDPSSSAARYLRGGSGLSVTTSDPGPLPRECVFVMRVRGPNVSGTVTNHTVAAQYEADPQRAWLLRRNETGGYFVHTTATAGIAAGAATRNGPNVPVRPSTGADELLAVAIQHDSATDTSFVTEWYHDGTYWISRGAGPAGPSVVPFDSNTVMRIGAFNSSGGDPFEGRIYSVELRTGLDPTGGDIIWRFDANEAPTDATTTTWTDPRGRVWTVSTPQAISGRTLWRFDANEAPTDATTTTWTDPRGRAWTVTNPQAISGRTLWRFDANDYPGTGTSYIDPRGRTWTLTAAGAITPKAPDTVAPFERVSHAITYVNDEAQLLNRVLTTNADDPALAVRGEDTLSVDRFGGRGRALGYPLQGLAFANADDATVWVTRVVNRFAYITRRVERLDVDTALDDGWLQVLVDLDTGRAISATRRSFHPFTLDAVIVGWRYDITPGRWLAELYTTTVTSTR